MGISQPDVMALCRWTPPLGSKNHGRGAIANGAAQSLQASQAVVPTGCLSVGLGALMDPAPSPQCSMTMGYVFALIGVLAIIPFLVYLELYHSRCLFGDAPGSVVPTLAASPTLPALAEPSWLDAWLQGIPAHIPQRHFVHRVGLPGDPTWRLAGAVLAAHGLRDGPAGPALRLSANRPSCVRECPATAHATGTLITACPGARHVECKQLLTRLRQGNETWVPRTYDWAAPSHREALQEAARRAPETVWFLKSAAHGKTRVGTYAELLPLLNASADPTTTVSQVCATASPYPQLRA